MRTTTPVISLVICTTGTNPMLAAALAAALRAVAACAWPAELLVVDNSATGTAPLGDVADSPLVRRVRAAEPGLSRARTVGCREAAGDIVVFTDDDVLVDPHWLDRMAEPILSGRAEAVASPIALSLQIQELGLPRLFRAWLAESLCDEEEPLLIGAGMAFHRSILAVARWEPSLGAGVAGMGFGEETLFSRLVARSGARIVRAAGPPVVHHPRLDRIGDRGWLRTAREKGRSTAYLAHHLGGVEDERHLPRLLAKRLRARLRLLRCRLQERGAVTPRRAGLESDVAYLAHLTRLRNEPRRYA